MAVSIADFSDVPVSPHDVLTVLSAFLAEARISVRNDPSTADRWLDRFEWVLTRTHAVPQEPDQGAIRVGGLAPWQISRVRSHIEANLCGKLRTSELAGKVRLSENHFARSFKISLGCPPHAYIIQQRIKYAKRLVLETTLPLSQVALESGLADQAHLSRLYRRFFGDTPSAARRQNSLPL
jgi:AraC family transcriptional regulator